jgi:hypothetical protein
MGAADLPVFEVVDPGNSRGGLDLALTAGRGEDEARQNAPGDGPYLLDPERARVRVGPQFAEEVPYAFVPSDGTLKGEVGVMSSICGEATSKYASTWRRSSAASA